MRSRSRNACQHTQMRSDCVPAPFLTARIRNRLNHTLFDMAVHPPRSDLVSREILRTGRWEIGHPQELASLADSTLEPAVNGQADPTVRRTFLDIGANIGFYSLLFAHHGWRVISVEPMTRNRAALEASLCLNPELRSRVTVVAAALGSAAQVASGATCVIRRRKGVTWNVGNGKLRCGTGTAGLHRCEKNQTSAECHAVALRTLDSVLTSLNPDSIDVVKADIEGSECDGLAGEGARSLFMRWRPAFLQWEGKETRTDQCMSKTALTHKYRIGQRCGDDMNTVMTTRPVAMAWAEVSPRDEAVGEMSMWPQCPPCTEHACGCCRGAGG